MRKLISLQLPVDVLEDLDKRRQITHESRATFIMRALREQSEYQQRTIPPELSYSYSVRTTD